MRINEIKENQNFGMAWHPASKRKLADMVAILRVKGKHARADLTIGYINEIERNSPNHTIYTSNVLNYTRALGNSHLASNSPSYGITIQSLPKNLEEINAFLIQDNERIARIKDYAKEIVERLKMSRHKTLYGTGWHIRESSQGKAVAETLEQLQSIAERIALLKSNGKGDAKVNKAIAAFNRIENPKGDYRVYYDNISGTFRVYSFSATGIEEIKDNGNILKTFRKIEKSIDKDIARKERAQRKEYKAEMRDRILMKALGIRKKIKYAIKESKTYSAIKSVIDYVPNRIKAQKAQAEERFQQVRQKVGEELHLSDK